MQCIPGFYINRAYLLEIHSVLSKLGQSWSDQTPPAGSHLVLTWTRSLSWVQLLICNCENDRLLERAAKKHLKKTFFPQSTFFGEIRCGPLGDLGGAVKGRRVRVTALIGDSQAAMLGEGCLRVGDAKLTLGTGAFLNVNIGSHVIPPNTGKCLCMMMAHEVRVYSLGQFFSTFLTGQNRLLNYAIHYTIRSVYGEVVSFRMHAFTGCLTMQTLTNQNFFHPVELSQWSCLHTLRLRGIGLLFALGLFF